MSSAYLPEFSTYGHMLWFRDFHCFVDNDFGFHFVAFVGVGYPAAICHVAGNCSEPLTQW